MRLSGLVSQSGGKSTNGWDFWAIQAPTGLVRLSTLRARYLKTKEST